MQLLNKRKRTKVKELKTVIKLKDINLVKEKQIKEYREIGGMK